MIIDLPVMLEIIEKQRPEINPLDAIAFQLSPTSKEAARNKIAADVEAFLSSGGVITVVPYGKTVELDPNDAWRLFGL